MFSGGISKVGVSPDFERLTRGDTLTNGVSRHSLTFAEMETTETMEFDVFEVSVRAVVERNY